MQQTASHLRLQRIYQMIFELAGGNFNNGILPGETDDELQSLSLLVGMVAKEMQRNSYQAGAVNPGAYPKYLLQTTIFLDESFAIESFNAALQQLLGYDTGVIVGKDFATLLTPDSFFTWRDIKEKLLDDNSFHVTVQLCYRANADVRIPAFCTISRLLHSTKTVISSVSVAVNDANAGLPLLGNTAKPVYCRADELLIQKLYDYILENLESPLPTVKELSRMLGTNEFKLKDGFKYFFKTSIHRFWIDERMKRIHLLIQQSSDPLKDIAFTNGFRSYPHFSAAFKKQFGYNPTKVKRWED